MKKIVLIIVLIASGLCIAQNRSQPAVRQFQEQTLPMVYDRFTSLSKSSPQGSMAYQGMLARGTADLNTNLAVLEQENMLKNIEWYTNRLTINPNDASLWAGLGHVYYNGSNFQQAIQCYSAAIYLAPSTALYYLNRANAYGMIGDRAAALADVLQSAALGDVNAQQVLRDVS